MLNRRSFIRKSGALAALTMGSYSGMKAGLKEGEDSEPKITRSRILPANLKKGDLIGLVTPGSPVSKEQLDEIIVKLENLGYKTYYKESVLSEYGYFAGKDRERAEELMHMFTNPKVDAIWCVRGGYGSIRILNLLDFDLIGQNPKVFIGYSDITALLTSIYEKTGLVTFHGPVGIEEFNDFTVKSLENVLLDPGNHYKYPYQRVTGTEENPEFDRYTVRKGKAQGELIGGNISVLDSMIGSNFEPDFENKIVYLEEIEEMTRRVDKMLFHLLEATNLRKAAGIVMGVFSDCNINDEPRLSLKVAIEDLLLPLNIPISYGLSFGHIDNIITIPNGILAKMNADRNTLKLMEKAVQE
ncbi:MAG: LD-carboxypeptidase [Bacteroidetes bacterium]|nr:MAG: LD-carboxypeptidase [Bacteroidota bacterium]